MNARHMFRISSLIAVVILTFGTTTTLASSHHQAKQSSHSSSHTSHAHAGHSNHAPSHASHAHVGHSAHGNLAHSSVHPSHSGSRVPTAVTPYHHPYPVHPVHRHPYPVVVARPFLVYPPVAYGATYGHIVNPVELGVTVSYMLDGQQFFLPPGGIQTLHRRCVISFDRGNGYGYTRLVLTGGTYTFGLAYDGGWSLLRS
jgi:hypothetical protein